VYNAKGIMLIHCHVNVIRLILRKNFKTNKKISVSLSDVISYDKIQVFSCEVLLIQTKNGEM